MSSKSQYVSEKIMSYILAATLREGEVQRRLREETARMSQSNMQISPEQGQLMGMLVKLCGARRIVEVGTFTGYSALCMAQALPEDGRLVACDVSKEWTDIGRRYWREAGVKDRIELILGSATETLEGLLQQGERFDLAFIDADKENYDRYYELCLQLLRPNGLLLIDNTLWDGKVLQEEPEDADTAAIQALNEKLSRDERIDLSMLPVSDGLTMVRKRSLDF